VITPQNPCTMIRHDTPEQPNLSEFEANFQPAMDDTNRWVRLSGCIPWARLSQAYEANLSATQGRPAKSARLVIGAMIIKHKLCLSDRETISQIQENPYLQYFVGLPGYQAKPPFAPSLFVEIRKRMGQTVFDAFQQAVVDTLRRRDSVSETDPDTSTTPTGEPQADPVLSPDTTGTSYKPSASPMPDTGCTQVDDEPVSADETAPATAIESTDRVMAVNQKNTAQTHQGQLILDATVAPQAIRYPTDLNLLNEARERTEQIIDGLCSHLKLNKKPRTYRQVARRAYLAVVKLKRPGSKRLRRGIRQQLQFLRRNLGHITRLRQSLASGDRLPLPGWLQARYLVIQRLYQQQLEMYQKRVRRCNDRIVSLSQPYVRPIVRGKVDTPVEFGSKLSVSLTAQGMAQVDHLSWDAFHEGQGLSAQVKAYRQRYQVYPEVVIADSVYGTRDNRRYLKSLGIRFAGKPLGRPKKVTKENQADLKRLKAQRCEEYRQRIPIEGKFGQGKNGYRLGYIRAKRADTSVAWINAIFFVMNLLVLWRIFSHLTNHRRFAAGVALFCLMCWFTIRCKPCTKQ